MIFILQFLLILNPWDRKKIGQLREYHKNHNCDQMFLYLGEQWRDFHL